MALQANLKKTALRSPGCYRLVALIVSVYLALINVLTAVEVLTAGQNVAVSYSVWLRAALSLAWVILFAGLSIGLMWRPMPALRLVAPILTVYGVCSVVWLVVFSRADFDQGRIAFQLAFTVMVLAPVWWFNFRYFPLRVWRR